MGFSDWVRRVLGAPSPAPLPSHAAQAGEWPQSAPDPRVDAAVEAMLRNPAADQDQTLETLQRCGFTPLEAWRAYQFVAIAFAHVVFRGRGVEFQPGYVLLDPESGARSTHQLVDEPLYAAGVAAAEARAARGSTPQQLLPVFGRSAEWEVIRQLVGPDGRLDGVVLTEPLLMTFESS